MGLVALSRLVRWLEADKEAAGYLPHVPEDHHLSLLAALSLKCAATRRRRRLRSAAAPPPRALDAAARVA